MFGRTMGLINRIRARVTATPDRAITFARRKQLMFRTIIVVSLVSFIGGYVRGAGGAIIFLIGMGIGVYIWRRAMVPAIAVQRNAF